ncbi:PREDICTED: endogenous retrovirus group K member 6 Pol protein-like [Corvus brachyrhynchos]|uniref:endogenous retrovirus group K member 6 Pol protein-like n=1 Tax=Corvus brachyrhynchos TaxID=85066 RepID=UPI00081662AF|nr:PREDICTED: endogenous retrovirus group K member 6 Pol protein-like [Corvus brachyrhynchos]
MTKNSRVAVKGPTVFTDGSGKTGKAIVTWKEGSEWQVLEGHESGSAQLVELRAVTMVFQQFSQVLLNLVTDSAYVADTTQHLDCSLLKEVNNAALFSLLRALWSAIQARVHPYYILHIRSHTNLPGFVTEGNASPDRLANPAWVAPQPDKIAQAKASHSFFHQSAHTLQKQLHLKPTEARNIVSVRADCHGLAAPLPLGVNARGLKALQLWQTDVTHIPEFGRLKYVYVSIDTFSSAMWASAHTGEKGRDVISHWKLAFSILCVPSVKTDNGPAYVSQKTWQFLHLWGVDHTLGITHSSTGQAIVECTHSTLKHVLEKQKGGMHGETPQSRLEKALYTIPQNSNNPVILNHLLSWQSSGETHLPRAKVWVQDLLTKKWEGPHELIAWGHGNACVSTDTGVRWLPARCIRPDLRHQQQNRQPPRQPSNDDQNVDHSANDPSDDDQDVDHQPGPSTSRD